MLRQTRPPDEVIVIDDGSRDETPVVLERYRGRIRAVRQTNGGVSRARNHGAMVATGELVAFLDADDTWEPRKLEVQLGRLSAHPDIVASFTETLFVDDRTGETEHVRYRNGPDMVATLLTAGCVIGNNSSVVVRRDLFLELGGYDPSLSQSADWDMWLRLAARGPFDLVREPLVRYRVHGSSMSRNIDLLEADNRRVLEKSLGSPLAARYGPRLRRRAWAHNHIVLAGSYLHARRFRPALRCVWAAALDDPTTLGRALGTPARLVRRALSGRRR